VVKVVLVVLLALVVLRFVVGAVRGRSNGRPDRDGRRPRP
jgi:hypothetical protein